MDFSALVGLPWENRGRGPGYDCWGLVVAAYRQGLGIELPSHRADYSSAADRTETAQVFAGIVGDWFEVERSTEQPFDVAVMKIRLGVHVGIIVRRGMVLHMPQGKSSVIEPLSRFGSMLTGIYRRRA